jgi:hypothetical protein
MIPFLYIFFFLKFLKMSGCFRLHKLPRGYCESMGLCYMICKIDVDTMIGTDD